MTDMRCPVRDKDGNQCKAVFNRTDMVFNNHLRFKHKGFSPEQRTRLRLKHTPTESGFRSSGVTREERHITNELGIK